MYYTDREVKELLEQAFAEGYDNGIDDTLDYIDENYELEDEFDLMDEYESYTESNPSTKAKNKETGKKELATNPRFSKAGTTKNGEDVYAFHNKDVSSTAIVKPNGRIKVSSQDLSGKNSYSKNALAERIHSRLDKNSKFYQADKNNIRFGVTYGNRNRE